MDVLHVTFNTKGNSLGFYYNIAGYIIIVPVVLTLLLAAGYNTLVGIASKWMYKNAFKKKPATSSADTTKQHPLPPSTVWEEVYVANIKVVNYLLGSSIELKEGEDGYLELHIHDYEVNMPLAMIFLQISQFFVLLVCLSLFVEYLVIEVSSTCKSSIDCFFSNETSWDAQPLDCATLGHNVSLTCFNLGLEPTIAAAIVGGTLKITPVFFSLLIYHFIKYVNAVKKKLNFIKNQNTIAVHIIIGIIVEIIMVGLGVTALLGLIHAPNIQPNAKHFFMETKSVFIFAVYFVPTFFLWCIYPLRYDPVRFKSAAWKQEAATKASSGVPKESKASAQAHELQPLAK